MIITQIKNEISVHDPDTAAIEQYREKHSSPFARLWHPKAEREQQRRYEERALAAVARETEEQQAAKNIFRTLSNNIGGKK